MTILTCEPAWAWNDKLPGNRGATTHLVTSTVEQICKTELPVLDVDSVLFLWRPASRLADALQVCAAWGFVPKTEIVWVKTTSTGKRAMGMGRVVRGEHETCIVAVRGKPEVLDHSVRSTFSAPQQPYAKPDDFYDIVASLYQGTAHAHTWYDRTAQGWSHGWRVHEVGKRASQRPAPQNSGFYTAQGQTLRPSARLSDRPSARRKQG
jgi:N6-adenosine-specific RNA methylase IME4